MAKTDVQINLSDVLVHLRNSGAFRAAVMQVAQAKAPGADIGTRISRLSRAVSTLLRSAPFRRRHSSGSRPVQWVSPTRPGRRVADVARGSDWS